jgi:hypothetical protein
LVYDDTDPSWAGAHDHVLDSSGMVFGVVRDSPPAETEAAHTSTTCTRAEEEAAI